MAEAYRRTLDTVHVREIEMLAAGDGFTETGTEPASIDAVGEPAGRRRARQPGDAGPAVAAVESESLDLPIELNEPVLSCIDLYQGRLRDWFETALSRGQQYLPHIREVFAEEGIPQDLAYVALVESAFKTDRLLAREGEGRLAVHQRDRQALRPRRRLVGGRAERPREGHPRGRPLPEGPLRASSATGTSPSPATTRARARSLRAMKRYRTDDFWELRKTRGLRRETKNYVPLIHAAIVIAKAPERYGFTVDPGASAPTSSACPIEGAFDLRVIAECAGEPVEDDPRPQPRAAAARDAGRPHLRAARARRAAAQAVAECVADAAAREAGELPQARGAARARRSPASPAPTA